MNCDLPINQTRVAQNRTKPHRGAMRFVRLYFGLTSKAHWSSTKVLAWGLFALTSSKLHGFIGEEAHVNLMKDEAEAGSGARAAVSLRTSLLVQVVPEPVFSSDAGDQITKKFNDGYSVCSGRSSFIASTRELNFFSFFRWLPFPTKEKLWGPYQR